MALDKDTLAKLKQKGKNEEKADSNVAVTDAPPAEEVDEKKKKENEEPELPEMIIPGPKIGAPPWIVTFADLTTLMLTFFVLLLSFANMDIVKFQELMGSMQESFGVSKETKGEYQLVKEPGEIAEKLGNIKSVVDKERAEKQMLVELVHDTARRTGMVENTQIFMDEKGVNVRLDSSVLFDSGGVELKKEAVPFIKGVAKIMRSFNFNLFVEGHTDNVPIRTKRFPSNWELSTVRATTVLRMILDQGVPRDRVAAAGYADRKPVRENDTPENRAYNRRVEFKFMKVQ